MGSFDRNVKHLTCKNITCSNTTGNDSSSCTIYSGIRTLGTSQTKFHYSVAFCCIAYSGSLSCDKALVINYIKDCSLYKLSFNDRSNYFNNWFSWKNKCSFGNGIYIACKVEVF